MSNITNPQNLAEFRKYLVDRGLAKDDADAHQITIEARRNLKLFGASMQRGSVIYHSGVSNILASSYGQKLADCFQKCAQLIDLLRRA